jgi:arylsulfatase A-like enzyme
VPLIIKPPAGTRTMSRRIVDTPVSMIDLFSTMADYCGLAEDREWPGLSLRPLMDNFPGSNREFIFAEWTCSSRAQWFPQRCVRDHRYKLIRTITDVRPCPAALRYAEARDWVSGTAPAELVAASTKVKRAYHEWENPPRDQLFDLQNDPSEWVNLAGSAAHAVAHRWLASALDRWQIATQDVVGDAASARPPPPG